MNARKITLAVLLVILIGALAIGWYRFAADSKPVVCGYCNRPLHANLTVTAEIDGKQTQVCCPRCAISEANQQHKSVRILLVHDYVSGRATAPGNAWFVEGSRAMACDHDAMRMNEMKGTQELVFDRCSPGVFSFDKKEDADTFTAHNGGSVISFPQLMIEARFQ